MDAKSRGRGQRAGNGGGGVGGKRCERCGLQVSKFSLANHNKWCLKSQDEKQEDRSASGKGEVVARVVTLGLTPGKPDISYVHAPARSTEAKFSPQSTNNTTYAISNGKARPTTTTLKESKLQKTGHGVPTQSKESSSGGVVRCRKCTRVVARNRLDAHVQMCEADSSKVHGIRRSPAQSKSSQQPKHQVHPTPASSPGQDTDPAAPEVLSRLVQGRTRKFVFCYICGREYTVHSIGIHIPQCTKKFYAENERLPIRQRRRFPKKPEPRVAMEDDRAVGGASVDVDTAVQNYLEHCYTTFEDTLIPCKVCGRTFAADRHRVHEPNCKAKPILNRS